MQPDDDSFPKRIFNGTNSSLNKHILRNYYVSFSLGERLIYIYDFYKNTKMKMATIITVVSHVDYWHRFEDRSIDRDPRLKRELLVHPPSPSRSCFALCILLPPPSLSLSSIDPTTLLLPRRRLRHQPSLYRCRSGPRPNLQNSQPRRSVKRMCNKLHGLTRSEGHARVQDIAGFCSVERRTSFQRRSRKGRKAGTMGTEE